MIQLALLLLSMTVHGRVTVAGAPLPGAVVKLTQNGHVRTTVSDLDGKYAFDGVRGAYTLSAEMEGLSVGKVHGTSIEMRLDVADETEATPAPSHLPIARGIAGAMDLAPGVH